MKTKNKIEFGKVDLPDEAFEPRNVKERITIFIDEDVLNAFRGRAKLLSRDQVKAVGYQTLINETLRQAVFPTLRAAENDDSAFDASALQELIDNKDALLSLLPKTKDKKRA